MEKSLLTLLTFISVWVGTLAPFSGLAQTTVFSDDFSTNTNATFTTSGVIGASTWSVLRSGADWGGRINTSPEQLELSNDVSATTNVNGWVLASTLTGSFSLPYATTLGSNPGLVTWTFNMRQIRPDPAGFGSGSYGAGFVLAGSSTTNNNTGVGYAVVVGQSGGTDPIRLVRYNNGLQGTLTNIITSNTTGLTDFGAEYLSIKVTYDPSNNTWELFLRNDGATAFADPATGTVSQGTAIDNTHTGVVLGLMGGYWQGSTTASQTAFFDNTKVTVTSPPNLSINNVALDEGNAGTTNFSFTVSLSSPAPAGGVTFDITTADGTATDANNDFEPQSLTSQTIPAGQSSYTFTVVVNGDVAVEANETFFVNVTNVTGATVTDGQGQGTIQNDDTCPTPTITVTESAGTLNDGTICPNNLATLATSASGTYQWSANNVLLPAETNSSIAVAPSITTTYTVTVTNGLCVGTATQVITVIPRPTTFTVTGGGSYCPGGSGVEVGLSGSEADVTYLLYQGATLIATVPGTGNPLSFGLQTVSATYFVQAYRVAYCSYNMTGSVVVSVAALDPNITVAETSGVASNDGRICIGSSATLTATGGGTYAWSTTETTASITVTPNITTLYSVTVTNGSCVGTDTLTIHVSPVPQVFNATGGGSYCGVGPGVEIGVSGSEVGVSYFLYRNSLYVDDIPGTGSAISFGFFTLPGNYDIVGSYPTNCFVSMTGTIVINTNGPSFTATPTNGACPESEPYVTLNVPAASGYKYDISTGATYTGTMTAGSGGTAINADPLEVDVFPSAPSIGGTQYTVRVIDVATGCYSDQTFTVSAIPVPCDCEAPPFVNFTPLNTTSCNVATVTIGYRVENGPALINTSGFLGTFSETTLNNGTGTFTYTPAPAEVGLTLTIFASIADPDGGDSCEGDTASANITINPLTEPTFFSPGTFCEGAIPTILPTTSNNGITGTWEPSSINTSIPGTYTFVFTPNPGQCADTASVKARVVAKREPAFSVTTTYCVDDTPAALPGVSLGGDSGTWNPSSINTSTAGTFTYVFTPTPGACADTASIKVTVNAKVEPVFSEIIFSYCEDETPEALPAESDNNIEGTWSPATVNTSTPGTTTYIFTPASGECADTASVKITINPKVKPTFSILSSYCQGQTPANLPATSNNGVAGTWNPSTISTATPGTTTYVFTPDNAECTDTASVKVVVSQSVSVDAGTPQTICVNQTLDLSELNASITGGATTGTWSSSGTGSFTGGTAFGTATAYVPSTADKNAGTITLTLTSIDPDGPCPAVVDTVVITIRNLNCSTFPWNGGK